VFGSAKIFADDTPILVLDPGRGRTKTGRLWAYIYIGLPDASLLSAFPGFEKVERQSLPDFLVTLVVREDGFEERFPDISKKRRSRIAR
jgi:hypothetical protein